MLTSSVSICQHCTQYLSLHRCAELDEILNPLQVHLAPKLSDGLLIGILGGVSKRLEAAIRKVRRESSDS